MPKESAQKGYSPLTIKWDKVPERIACSGIKCVLPYVGHYGQRGHYGAQNTPFLNISRNTEYCVYPEK